MTSEQQCLHAFSRFTAKVFDGVERAIRMCTDIVTPEHRSKIMSMIKGKNTKPEMVVRSVCHEMGLRYRLHKKDLPGTPDLVFPKHRLCIFVHGCFWHRHPGCKYAYTPKSKLEFWLPKLARNVERDLNTQQTLLSLGWRVLVVWECDTKNRELLRTEIQKAFGLNA
ncbi:DNA mismatch endonuclease (patch repair protein) [Pseudomonas sp. PvR086]